MEFAINKMTKDQSRDTGMAMVLLLLLLDMRFKRHGILVSAIVLQVVNMTVPQVFKPVAVVWLAFSHLLGTVMSKVLLSVLFFGFVTPVAFLRRMFGKDSLQLRDFKSSEKSTLISRDHLFRAQDINKPY